MALGKRGWFYGWYFKCQSDTQTLAVIPAVHWADRKRTCSIQIITEKQSWTVSLPEKVFRKRGRMIFIGKNRFGERGICLSMASCILLTERTAIGKGIRDGHSPKNTFGHSAAFPGVR